MVAGSCSQLYCQMLGLNTVGHCCNAAQHNMIFHASLQSVTEVEYKSKVFTQQKAPDIAPSQASCGVSFVTSYNGILLYIMASDCMYLFLKTNGNPFWITVHWNINVIICEENSLCGCSVKIGFSNGLLLSGKKPLPEALLTRFYESIWCHLLSMS